MLQRVIIHVFGYFCVLSATCFLISVGPYWKKMVSKPMIFIADSCYLALSVYEKTCNEFKLDDECMFLHAY